MTILKATWVEWILNGSNMKAWKINGNWLHKRSGKKHNLQFIVVCEDNDDPVGVLNMNYDLSGMTYLNGQVEHEDIPLVISMSNLAIIREL